MRPISGRRNRLAPGPRPDAAIPGLLLACLAALASCSGCATAKQKTPAAKQFEIDKQYKRGPVEFHVRIDRKEITIADRLRLELEVRAEEGYGVRLPEFGENLEDFGIVDYTAPPPALGENNRVIYRKSYVLEPFLSGDYKIPPMKVVFWREGSAAEKGGEASKKEGETEGTAGGEAKKQGEGGAKKEYELASEELTVRVKSLLGESASKLAIADISPPVELPRRAGRWVLWLAGVGASLAAVLAAIFFWRRRRRREAPAARRPAHEIAYEELESLLAQRLVEEGEIKAFCAALSDILRRYIERRFGLQAPERTTEEFLAEIRGDGVFSAERQALLANFLQRCDLVKFAEHQPTTGEIQQTFDACKQFIEETAERPGEAEPVEGGRVEEVSHAV